MDSTQRVVTHNEQVIGVVRYHPWPDLRVRRNWKAETPAGETRHTETPDQGERWLRDRYARQRPA